jgi:hypothetical protein
MKNAAIYSACLMVSLASFAMADEPATLPATQPTTIATTEPSTMPATLPATLPSAAASVRTPASVPTTGPAGRSKTLPKDYAVLTTRSIFMKGRVPTPIPGGGVTAPPTTQISAGRPEHKIVFVGVTETDGTASAMFEDTGAGKIISCKRNDPIASGKVTEITLDTITYTADGKGSKILVGQTLDAGDGPPVSARATIVDNGNGPPTTGPTAGGSGVSSSGGGSGASENDVLERLKAKRRQELGQ